MKLLVVDDHPIVRDGLAALLGQLGPDTVVLQVGDAERALRSSRSMPISTSFSWISPCREWTVCDLLSNSAASARSYPSSWSPPRRMLEM